MIFTKPLTEQHGTGLLLIAMGIVLKMLPENKPSRKPSISNSQPAIETVPQNEDRRGSFELGYEEEEEKRPLV